MKKYSTRYKALSTFCLLFIIAISLMFSFLVGKKGSSYYIGDEVIKNPALPMSVYGNVFYWIIKIVALLWIVAVIVLTWLPNASFHKYFPLTLAGIIFQAVPALCRVGYSVKGIYDGKLVQASPVSTWVYFMVVILLFILLGAGLLYAISNDQFKEQEKKAKHSSNYK